MLKKVGEFENINIYESMLFKKGHGLTIPQIGIITYQGAFSEGLDLGLVKHEFGHVLQYNMLRSIRFYLTIGFPSLMSAVKASLFKNYLHQSHQVEIDANQLSYNYFNKPKNWDFKRFPIL